MADKIQGMSAYVDRFFAAAQANRFGVIRRNVDTVIRLGYYDEILRRAKENDWHVVETGGQLVVLCHPGTMQIHV